jgi:hypothetical protein
MLNVITCVMHFGMAMHQHFMMTIKLRLMDVLHRQKGECAHNQG